MRINKKLWLLVALAAAPLAQAETLLLDSIDQAAQTASQRPRSGMSMAAVEAQFGKPPTQIAPVGDPPITRWEYPSFTVYFEYDHVIHAVERR